MFVREMSHQTTVHCVLLLLLLLLLAPRFNVLFLTLYYKLTFLKPTAVNCDISLLYWI